MNSRTTIRWTIKTCSQHLNQITHTHTHTQLGVIKNSGPNQIQIKDRERERRPYEEIGNPNQTCLMDWKSLSGRDPHRRLGGQGKFSISLEMDDDFATRMGKSWEKLFERQLWKYSMAVAAAAVAAVRHLSNPHNTSTTLDFQIKWKDWNGRGESRRWNARIKDITIVFDPLFLGLFGNKNIYPSYWWNKVLNFISIKTARFFSTAHNNCRNPPTSPTLSKYRLGLFW